MKKSTSFTDDSDVRLGFEIEFVLDGAFTTARNRYRFITAYGDSVRVVPSTKLRRFQVEMMELAKSVKYGEDGSIKCTDYDKPVEMRTVPLPPKSAIKLLEKLLEIVNKYGYTNSSCGFHINISSAHKSKMKKFNPLPFLASPLWDEILKKFKRLSNEYCRPLLTDAKSRATNYHTIHNLLQRSRQDKYRCVNLRHFGNGVAKHSRIEIRGIGNADYSKKFNVISAYIKRIEKLFRLSCSSFSEVKTPKV